MRQYGGLLHVKQCTIRAPFLTTLRSYIYSVIVHRHLKPCWFIGELAVVCEEAYVQEFGVAAVDLGLICVRRLYKGWPFATD